MRQPELHPHAYVLAVRDLEGSAAYFRDVLGFTPVWRDEDRWQGLRRGNVGVNLGHCPADLAPAALGSHNYFGFFATDDVDRLHAEFEAKGAIIVAGPADKPWGWREMAVATPEGHRMMFAQRIQPERP